MSPGKFADHFPYLALITLKSIFLKVMHNLPKNLWYHTNSLLQDK